MKKELGKWRENVRVERAEKWLKRKKWKQKRELKINGGKEKKARRGFLAENLEVYNGKNIAETEKDSEVIK